MGQSFVLRPHIILVLFPYHFHRMKLFNANNALMNCIMHVWLVLFVCFFSSTEINFLVFAILIAKQEISRNSLFL